MMKHSSVHEKGHKSIITDFEEESQGTINFSLEGSGEINSVRTKNSDNEDEGREKSEATLRKVKHMQNILKKEGLSNKTMDENIDTFEDVPAYIRRNMSLGSGEKAFRKQTFKVHSY